MKHVLFYWFILLTVLIGSGTCFKGLLVMTTGSKSNMNFFGSIVEALAESGHEITLITPFSAKQSSSRKEARRIVIQDDRDTHFGNKFEVGFLESIRVIYEHFSKQCIRVLTDPKVQEALNEHYDYVMLALVNTDCFLGYTYEKKLPLIYLNQNELFFSIGQRFGVPYFPVLSPASIMGLAYPTSLWQRVKQQSLELLLHFTFGWLIQNKLDNDCRFHKLWKPSIPSIEDLHRQPAILFVNSVRAVEYPPKALPPNVIYAGGIHINPSTLLEMGLKQWLDDSGQNGFIFFSLGTSVRSEDMSEKNFATLMSVFGSLKQRVLFKWHSVALLNIPKNVKVIPWVSQQAVLNHPNICAFVTHGGLFSIIEATYFHVPIVGIPVYMDQTGNVARAVSEGWAKKVDWNTLNENELRSSIEEVILNEKYREVVNRRSTMMRNWPRSPQEEVVTWVNYTVKLPNTNHLRIPLENHYWFQLFNLDVWAVMICLILSFIYFTYELLRFCFYICLKSPEREKRD